MKTNWKHILSLTLAVAMILSCIPGAALVGKAAVAATAYDKLTGRAIAVNYDGYMEDSGKDWAEELLATLPATATIDGAGEYAITWPAADEIKAIVNPDLAGFYAIAGSVEGVENAVDVIIQVREVANMLFNPSFETSSWNAATGWYGGYLSYRSTSDTAKKTIVPTPVDGDYSFQIYTNPNAYTQTQLRYQDDTRARELAAAVKAAGDGQYFVSIYAMDSTSADEAAFPYPEHTAPLSVSIDILGSTATTSAGFEYLGSSGNTQINREGFAYISEVFTLENVENYNWMRTDFLLRSEDAFAGRMIFVDMAQMIALNVASDAEPVAIDKIVTELPAYAIAEGYDTYVGEGWQEKLGLPATVEVVDENGNNATVDVVWDYSKVDFSKRGAQIVTGALSSATLFNSKGLTVQQRLYVVEAENLFTNPSFEIGWTAWAGQYNTSWKVSQPASGDYALGAQSHATFCPDYLFYCLMKSTTTTNCTDVAEKVAALGAGQYYVGAKAKDYVNGEEVTHADPLGVFIKLSSNKDGGTSYTSLGVGETVTISHDNYVTVGNTYELDGTDKALFTELYLTSTSKFYGQWVLVDDMQFIPLKVTLKEEPAYIEEIVTELTEYSIAKNYDVYAGANWQNALGLPAAVEVVTSEGAKATVEVTWDYSNVDFTQLGKQTITGKLSEKELFNTKGLTVQQNIYVNEAENLFTNGGFEDDWAANWSGRYYLKWNRTPAAEGYAAVAVQSSANGSWGTSYPMMQSTNANKSCLENTNDIATKVAAIGAGQYYVGGKVKDFIDEGEENHADPLSVYIRLSSNTDGSTDWTQVGDSAKVLINQDAYVTVGGTFELTGAEKSFYTELYLTSTSTFYGQWILVDDMQFIALKTEYTAPAEHECTPAEAVKENEKAADCVNAGSYDSVIYCSECGKEISRETVPVDALGHTWSSDADSTCNVCGEVREATPALDASLNIQKHTMQITSDLKLGFSVDVADVKDAADFYVVFYKADGITAQNVYTTVTKEAIIAGGVSNNRYYAYYPKVLAGEMNDAIEAVLYVVDADGTVRCSETDTYSVVDYLTLLMTTYQSYPAYVNYMTVSVELLGYGAAAQENFGYKTETPANAIVFEKGWDKFALAEDPTPVNNRNWGAANNSQKVIYKGSGLKLEESIYSNIRIDASKLTAEEFAALKMVIKAGDGTVVQTIESKDYSAHTTAGNYYVTITKILPKDMAKVYTLEMYVGETLVSTAATYSVESYVRLLQDSGLSAGAVALAALRYGTAAALLG